jgi:hypothetical protein
MILINYASERRCAAYIYKKKKKFKYIVEFEKGLSRRALKNQTVFNIPRSLDSSPFNLALEDWQMSRIGL